jgi:hypothetical protein
VTGSSKRGPVGFAHNTPYTDPGTLGRLASPPLGPVGTKTNPARQKIHIRLPTIEIFAFRGAAAFTIFNSPLTPAEKDLAREIFGESIDLEAVRILVSPIVNAPTTLGNCIRAGTSAIPKSTLIHELTHIWQFQTKGISYISDSLLHQTAAWLSTGSRNAAYNPEIVSGKSIHNYTAEEQAVIVENYFANVVNRGSEEYQRMIDEVRSSRPLPEYVGRRIILEESAFGPSMSSSHLFEVRAAPEVPLIRIEF